MQRYILRRLGEALVCVWVISLVVFGMVRLSGDPLALMLPPAATAEDIAALRHQLALDKPIYVQYLDFVGGAIRGDLGQSIRWNQPTFRLWLDRFPATIQLALASMCLALAIGLPVGILSAVRPGGLVDRFGKVFALLGQSLPTFWVGLMLMLVFAVTLRWLPVAGMGGWQNLVLPAVTLGWFSVAALTRLTRSAMLDVLDSEYVKLARTKGVPEPLVIVRHALRNALIPIVTMAALQFAALLNGSVITETIFAWPGIGRLSVDAVFARDFPVVQTSVLLTSGVFVLTNLAIDVGYAWLDPRIRYR